MNEDNKVERKHSSLPPEVECRVSELFALFATQKEAANVANVSVAQLRRYLKGDSQLPFEPIARLAEAKGVSLDWFWSGKGEMLKNAIHESPAGHSVSANEFDKILEKVENAVLIIESALEKKGASMPPEKKGKLAAMCVDYLYDLPEDEKPDSAKILRLVKFGT